MLLLNYMNKLKLFFENQPYNYLFLVLFFVIANYLSNWPGVFSGQFLGLSTAFWFWLTLITPVVHQLFVWFAWRSELHYGLLSKWFGMRAFDIYAAIFTILILGRGLFIVCLGISNLGSWQTGWAWRYIVSFVLLLPIIYTMYSVNKYFTFRRAFGIDHFDPSFRNKPLVDQGIYRYTNNAMYTFAALSVWLPALLFASKAALISAVFNYGAVWVHYFTTEKPDMKHIYGDK